MIKPKFLFRIFDEIPEAMGSSVNEFQAAKLQKEIRVAVSLLFYINMNVNYSFPTTIYVHMFAKMKVHLT